MAWEWLRRRRRTRTYGPVEPEPVDGAEVQGGSPYRGAHAQPDAPARQPFTVGRAAAALIDFDYEAALAAAVDAPRRYAITQQLELQRFEPGPHLLPFELRSSVLPGVGGSIVVMALFALGERNALVLPHWEPERRRLDAIPALWIPALERLREPDLRRQFRQAMRPMATGREGVVRLELGPELHRALLRAREQGSLGGERLIETLRVLDLLLGYVGGDPNELSLAQLWPGWEVVPARAREQIAAATPSLLEPWERGDDPAPASIVAAGERVRVLAYANKRVDRWYSSGWRERASRLVLELDAHSWSLTRTDLWVHEVRGTEYS